MEQKKPADSLSVADRWDRILRLLSHEPRRQLILTLSEKPPDTWAALPEAALSSHFEGTRDELSVTLHHQHLPALAEADYVRWKSAPFEVARGPHFEELEVVVETIISGANSFPNRLVHGCEPLERSIG